MPVAAFNFGAVADPDEAISDWPVSAHNETDGSLSSSGGVLAFAGIAANSIFSLGPAVIGGPEADIVILRARGNVNSVTLNHKAYLGIYNHRCSQSFGIYDINDGNTYFRSLFHYRDSFVSSVKDTDGTPYAKSAICDMKIQLDLRPIFLSSTYRWKTYVTGSVAINGVSEFIKVDCGYLQYGQPIGLWSPIIFTDDVDASVKLTSGSLFIGKRVAVPDFFDMEV